MFSFRVLVPDRVAYGAYDNVKGVFEAVTVDVLAVARRVAVAVGETVSDRFAEDVPRLGVCLRSDECDVWGDVVAGDVDAGVVVWSVVDDSEWHTFS